MSLERQDISASEIADVHAAISYRAEGRSFLETADLGSADASQYPREQFDFDDDELQGEMISRVQPRRLVAGRL